MAGKMVGEKKKKTILVCWNLVSQRRESKNGESVGIWYFVYFFPKAGERVFLRMSFLLSGYLLLLSLLCMRVAVIWLLSLSSCSQLNGASYSLGLFPPCQSRQPCYIEMRETGWEREGERASESEK